MAWIESHQSLERHPKLWVLSGLTGWDQDTAISKLHRHWWWCLDYAPDGDLRKFHDTAICAGFGVAASDAKKIVGAMVEARWLDRQPYFRVHDWWQYAGRFLQVKYKNRETEWRRIQALYVSPVLEPPLEPPKEPEPTNQPNLTQPTNQPSVRALVVEHPKPHPNSLASFEMFWSSYPKQVKRTDAEHAFIEVGAHLCTDAVIAAIEVQRRSQAWKKDGGRYIPDPANWLRNKQWQDQTPEMRQQQRKIAAVSKI